MRSPCPITAFKRKVNKSRFSSIRGADEQEEKDLSEGERSRCHSKKGEGTGSAMIRT